MILVGPLKPELVVGCLRDHPAEFFGRHLDRDFGVFALDGVNVDALLNDELVISELAGSVSILVAEAQVIIAARKNLEPGPL